MVPAALSADSRSANLKGAERGRTQIPRRNAYNSVHWRGGEHRKPDQPQGHDLHEARQNIFRHSSCTQVRCRSCSSDPRGVDPHCRSGYSEAPDSAHSPDTLYISQPTLPPDRRPPALKSEVSHYTNVGAHFRIRGRTSRLHRQTYACSVRSTWHIENQKTVHDKIESH